MQYAIAAASTNPISSPAPAARGGRAERRENPGADHRTQPDHDGVRRAEPTRQSRLLTKVASARPHFAHVSLPVREDDAIQKQGPNGVERQPDPV